MFIKKIITGLVILLCICMVTLIIILSIYFVEKARMMQEEENARLRSERELKEVSFEGPSRWEMDRMLSTIRKNEKRYKNDRARYRPFKIR